MNTGRTNVDYCGVVNSQPAGGAGRRDHGDGRRRVVHAAAQRATFCDLTTPWGAQTQVKVAAVYTLPYDIQASVSYQYFPGVTPSQRDERCQHGRNNALISPSLGRNLVGVAPTRRW